MNLGTSFGFASVLWCVLTIIAYKTKRVFTYWHLAVGEKVQHTHSQLHFEKYDPVAATGVRFSVEFGAYTQRVVREWEGGWPSCIMDE